MSDDLRRQDSGPLRTAPLFVAALLLTLLAAGFSGLMVLGMMLEVDLPGAFGQMTHFQEPHHRIHDLTFGFLFVPPVVGVLAQLRRPVANVAGMVMALIPSAGMTLTLLLTLALEGDARVVQPPWIMVGTGALLALSLHPAGRGFLRSFQVSRADRLMLGLVALAAIPLLALASTAIGLQAGGADDHAAAGHYGFMAGFAFTIIGVGALAGLRPDGWRITAWVAGLLPALLGIASLVYPQAASSLEPAWALAAIAWGAVFVVVAERSRDATGSPVTAAPGSRA